MAITLTPPPDPPPLTSKPSVGIHPLCGGGCQAATTPTEGGRVPSCVNGASLPDPPGPSVGASLIFLHEPIPHWWIGLCYGFSEVSAEDQRWWEEYGRYSVGV